MYLALDIGGTKTLLAVFSAEGKLLHEQKLATAKRYDDFLVSLNKPLSVILQQFQLSAACCAVPGIIDRGTGLVTKLGNLNWRNVSIGQDLSQTLKGLPVQLENDAKLAALAEAVEYSDFKKLLYFTIGTGIGVGLVINGVIDTQINDAGGKALVLEHKGKLTNWEDLASGHAIVQKYGKKASQITDPAVWVEYAKLLALGMYEYIATFSPDIVVIGGGVGTHFDKFSKALEEALKAYKNPMVDIPPLRKAAKPEEAVIYGCYYYIRHSS